MQLESELLSVSVAPVQVDPVVSVCIANWNCCDLLYNCLASLLEQDQGVPFEIIVVDNASSDGAAEMVREKFPEVLLVRNTKNLGFSVANNQAAQLAQGHYLFFLNNDTWIPERTLCRLVESYQANPDAGMIGPRLRDGDGNLQISYRCKPTLGALFHRVSFLRWTGVFRSVYYDYRRNSFNPEGTHSVEVLMGAAVFLPREIFERSGKWDESYRFGGEDLDLSTQIGRHRPLLFLGHIEITHFGRMASRMNVGFASPNVAIGYVHYFRKSGVSSAKLRLYKLLVSIDAPFQCMAKLVQAGTRRIRGDRERAQKSYQSALGLWHFLTKELVRFWWA